MIVLSYAVYDGLRWLRGLMDRSRFRLDRGWLGKREVASEQDCELLLRRHSV